MQIRIHSGPISLICDKLISNKYIDLAAKFDSDWMLMLDADEFITDETNWATMYSDLHELGSTIEHTPAIFGVTMKPYGNAKVEKSYPRMWRNPRYIRYMKTHNFFQFPDGRVFKSSFGWKPVKGIFMKGDDKLRNESYLKKSYNYQVKLKDYERPIKAEYRKIAENTKNYDVDPRLPPGVPVM